MSCQPRAPFRLLATLLCLLAVSTPAMAAEVDSGGTYCFALADFAGDPESALAGVCVTGIPEDDQGTICLGSRTIRAGDILTAGQLENLTFSPKPSQEDAVAVMRYLPVYNSSIAPETTLTISIHGKEDKAPAAEDSALETYKNLPNEGLLKVSDPEGQPLVYTLVRAPKRGSVILREDGSFVYTPEKNKVGTDSFTYTATDPAGNVSREATVTVKILKPTDSVQYTDTIGQDCRFAAEWMRNTGIFAGETVSGQSCFSPGESVTRGQFLTMLMEVLELPGDHSAQATGFLDEAEDWMKPYLAAALRSGIITGYPCEGGIEFRPGQAITRREAETMIRCALDLAVPAWSADDAEAENGVVFAPEDAPLTRSDAAVALYQVSKLRENATTWSSLLP